MKKEETTMLYVIARAYGDDILLPFTQFTAYSSKEQALKNARPPVHIPMHLEMVLNYLEKDENELYGNPPAYIRYNAEEGGYGFYDDDYGYWNEWNPEKGPWIISTKKECSMNIPLSELVMKCRHTDK
jgi:hypothetical protein